MVDGEENSKRTLLLLRQPHPLRTRPLPFPLPLAQLHLIIYQECDAVRVNDQKLPRLPRRRRLCHLPLS